MIRNSNDDYIKEVKAKYEEAKTGVYSVFLQNPSPAELKNLCLVLLEKGICKQDQEIFNTFFELDDKSSKRRQLEYFDVNKLRPIVNFLKGKTETTRIVNLDLISVLVDFNLRPYRKFMSGNKEELTDEVNVIEILKKDKRGEKEDEKKGGVFEEFKKKRVSKRIGLAIMPLFVLGSVIGVKKVLFPDKNCMLWVKNHYEAVQYDKVKDTTEVIPLNQEVLENFKKITVCDTSIFFKNGDIENPLVWYGKSPDKKEYEYFNQPGLHPETGKTLRPITKYIIEKYIIK